MSDIYSRIITNDGFKQVRLYINEFREQEYLHIREFYLDFDEEWKPTPKGISIPLEIETSKELFIAISEILSLAESKKVVEEVFGDLIKSIYDS
jgi:hypothetical protein